MKHLMRHSREPICLGITNVMGKTVRCAFHFRHGRFHGCYIFGFSNPKGFPYQEAKKLKSIPYKVIDLNGLVRKKNSSCNLCIHRFIGGIIVLVIVLTLVIKILSKFKIDVLGMVGKIL